MDFSRCDDKMSDPFITCLSTSVAAYLSSRSDHSRPSQRTYNFYKSHNLNMCFKTIWEWHCYCCSTYTGTTTLRQICPRAVANNGWGNCPGYDPAGELYTYRFSRVGRQTCPSCRAQGKENIALHDCPTFVVTHHSAV